MEKNLKILILEDSEIDAEIIQRLVKKAMAQVDFKLSVNRQEYITALNEFEPDMILADNSLPQFDASEALEIVRSRSLHIPFILITGTVSEEFAVEIIKKGADDYILKDRLTRLPAAIDTAIKKRRSEKEKQDAVQKIIEAEEKYRTLIQRISDGFIALDTEWRYIYVNKKIEEMTGRTAASLIGKNIWGEFPDATGSATYETFHKAMETQEFMSNIDYYEPLDLWQENTVYPSPDGLSVFVRDITKQKKAEIAIRQSEEIRRLVMNAALDAIICIDINGAITVWNAQAEKMFGWTEEEVKGKDVSEIIIPVQYRELHKRGMQHYCDTGEGPVLNRLLELTALNRAGIEFPVELSIVPVQQRNSKFFCAFIRDITLRKKAEEALRTAHERLVFHIENAPLGFIEWNNKLELISWSKRAEEIFGWTEEEFMKKQGDNYGTVYEDDRDEMVVIGKQLMNGDIERITIQHRNYTKSGKVIWCEWYNSVLKNEEGKVVTVLSLVKDITARKESEDLLQKSYEDIRELASHLQDVREEERTSMAREIHDELGQQLTGFKMDIFWLKRKLDSADKEIQEKIKSTLQLIDAAIKTVRRISTDLRPSILDDLGFITAMEWQSDEFEKRSGVKVFFDKKVNEIELSPKTSIALFRIYQELLTNVARHANASIVRSAVFMSDGHLCLSVTDNGVGFDVANISSKKTLGLLGMKERTLLLQGTYEIQSTPGKGTTIVIAVPLERVFP